MKKQFIAHGQTRFSIPVASFSKDGSMRKYSKAFKLAVGSKKVVRDVCGETEEGYSSVYELWENDGGTLYRVIHSESSDCDGNYSSVKEQKLVDGLWLKVNESQRDHSAERAGY